MNVSLNIKVAEAPKHAQAKKLASQICHVSGPVHGSIPTNSVDVTDSVTEDVSTTLQISPPQ